MLFPAININIVITVALVAGALMGMLGGRGRLKPVIMSIYIGLVLATNFAEIVQPYLGLSLVQSSWILLTLPVIFFGAFGTIQNMAKGSLILNLIIGMFTGALLLTCAFMLMPLRDQSALSGDSYMAYELQQLRPWLLGLMPLAVLLLGIHLHHKKKKKHAKP
jgi:hypothetical protein